MASFRVHEDQENRISELRQKPAAVHAVQQKRAVLGVIDNRNDRFNKKPLESAPVNKVLAEKVPNRQNAKSCEENVHNKQNLKNLVAPVVPVAQFEAFKVYEDEEQENTRLRKPKNDLSDIYKATNEDRFLTKKEALEMVKNKERELLKFKVTEESPMSIEKSFKTEVNDENKVVTCKSTKDLFFEMAEYRSNIYYYLRERELSHRPKAGYMKKQPDITHDMRCILVDWLVEVAEEYKLHTETLYLAVNFIDRFLSYMSVVRGKLQLVGTAAMFIAAKYEEIYPPNVSEFVYITDDTYNQRQVIRMEHLIIKILSFDLSIPTPLTFITATCIINKLSEKTMNLAMYLCELAMLETEPYLETLPSVLASAAIALARHTLDETPWTEELHKNTGYELKHLQKCIEFLHSMFTKAPKMKQQAIQEKYKREKYLHVASLTPKSLDIQFD